MGFGECSSQTILPPHNIGRERHEEATNEEYGPYEEGSNNLVRTIALRHLPIVITTPKTDSMVNHPVLHDMILSQHI